MAPKKQLGLIEIDNPPARAVRLGWIPDPRANPHATTVTELFAIDGLYVHRMNRLELPHRTVRSADQFEMPLDGVRWMVDAIEQVLERNPSEGGAPRGVLHADGETRGERLIRVSPFSTAAPGSRLRTSARTCEP